MVIENKIIQLNDKNFLSQIQKRAEEVLNQSLYDEAKEIWQRLYVALSEQPNFQIENPELYKEYVNIIIKLQWFSSLPALSENVLIDLFQNHLVEGFAVEPFNLLNIRDRLRARLTAMPILDDRDALKRILREALMKNKQIFLNRLTVSEWLTDFIRNVGTGKVEKIKLIEYANTSERAKSLSSEDKKKLLDLLNLFIWLGISSFEPEGLEEFEVFKDESGQLKYVFEGTEEVVKLGRATSESQPLEKAKSSAELKLIEPEDIAAPKEPEIPEIVEEKFTESATPPTEAEELEVIEKEAEALKSEILTPPIESLTYEQAIKNTIEKTKLSFTDEILENRFKNVAISFLKDVRDEIETRLVLKRPEKIGGMEYDEAKIDEIIKILKEQKPQIKLEIKPAAKKAELAEGLATPAEIAGMPEPEELPIEPEEMPVPPPPKEETKKVEVEKPAEVIKFETGPLIPPVPSEAIKQGREAEVDESIKEEKTEKGEFKIEEEKNVSPADLTKVAEEVAKTESSPAPTIPEISLEEMTKEKPEEVSPVPSEVKGPAPEVPLAPLPEEEKEPVSKIEDQVSSIQINRPPVEPVIDLFAEAPSKTSSRMEEEIKITPKIYGPIDELRTISLEDWRRWGRAYEAANRILEKINLLAEESLLKKAEGVKAWKESEVHKLYLDIGNEAIETAKPVEEVIKTRMNENRPTLTMEEFNMIAELNQRLRF